MPRSPSCAAVKIRCRSRRTLSSWCRQSMASQSGRVRPSSRSVHHRVGSSVSNLPFGSGGHGQHRFKAHLPTSAPFRARAPGPVSGQLSSDDRPGGAPGLPSWFPVAFRPPAFASWASCPAGEFRLSSRSAYRRPPAGRTLTGFPCSARMRCDRGGCPPLPRGRRCSHDRRPNLRSPPAASQRPALYPAATSHRPGLAITRHHEGSLAFTRPVFPSPVAPGWNGGPWASPRASHPAVTSDARQGGDGP